MSTQACIFILAVVCVPQLAEPRLWLVAPQQCCRGTVHAGCFRAELSCLLSLRWKLLLLHTTSGCRKWGGPYATAT